MTGERTSERQSRADQIDRELGEAVEQWARGHDGAAAYRIHQLTRERARLLGPVPPKPKGLAVTG